jgi:uncharacterized membrane protein YfcA
VGAKTLLWTGQDMFLKLVPWLLLFGTVLYALGGPMRNWLDRLGRPRQGAEPAHVSFTPAMFFGLIIVCFYVGYFGAGAGFLIITVLTVVGGMPNLTEVNALKMVLNAVANGVAVVTFMVAGAVYWKECLIMLGMAAAGGYVSAHYSRNMNPRSLRWFIIVSGLGLSIYFFQKTW